MLIAEQIAELKKQRNAVILAHNYQIDAVQDLADYVGDSLGLAHCAARVDADVIVFCGVWFMAETAFIVNPGKTVLVPDPDATCPMAQMMDVEKLQALKSEYPDATVMCYVNSSAEVKALSDVCCTSSNAVAIAQGVRPDVPIIFVPDQHLGRYVGSQTGRSIIPCRGFCPTHVRIVPEKIEALRELHPDAEVLAHPECPATTLALADVVTSTSGMLKHARRSNAHKFIIATEVGLLHRLRLENPTKEFIPASPAGVCPNMKRTTPEKILWALQEMKTEVRVPEPTCTEARRAIDAMLAVG